MVLKMPDAEVVLYAFKCKTEFWLIGESSQIRESTVKILCGVSSVHQLYGY